MDPETKLRLILQTANDTPAVRTMMTGWHRNVSLSVDTNTYAIALADGRAILQDVAQARPDLSFTLSEQTLDELMQGMTTPLAAKLAGKISSSGSILDILRFAAILTAAVNALSTTQSTPHGVRA
jgi:putative sterol carrier protein